MSEQDRKDGTTRKLATEAPAHGSRVDRRRFLEAAGVAGVGLTVGEMLGGASLETVQAAGAVDTSAPARWDMTADVVVVGTGGAGFAAATTARSNGASVIMLEKGAIYGGTTAKSGGEYWIPNNSFLRRAGLKDPKEWALRYMVRLAYPNSTIRTSPGWACPSTSSALSRLSTIGAPRLSTISGGSGH